MSDRPLECSDCKKPTVVHYTEIVGDTVNRWVMCSDCPVVQRRLHGSTGKALQEEPVSAGAALSCGNCGTTLDAVRKGNPVGCKECYEVFADILEADLRKSGALSARFAKGTKKATPLHIGRTPGGETKVSPSARLLVLHEALNETLTREDYEEAARLRDEIKALEESANAGKKGKK